MLLRITYASTVAPAREGFDIDAVVEHARLLNQERGITGVLAFDGERIVQILEGPAGSVAALFERIRQDHRHHGVVELHRAEIEETCFERWGMVRRSIADVLMMAEAIQAPTPHPVRG